MIGSTLGPYEILEPLGAGGMGEVFLAEDPRLGRKVAIKVLPEEFADNADRLARFEQEARAAASLNHPHIAAVHDIGVEGGTHYIVEEYLEGHTLRTHLDEGGFSLPRSLTLAAEIAEALTAAHAHGIVHRDLKPENLFITADGHAKILDFGLAKLIDDSPGFATSSPGPSKSPTRMATAEGQLLGTAGYMAPEQVEGREVDARADIFAFGCVLYELIGGVHPFLGQSAPETMAKILHEQPGAPAPSRREGLGLELWRILAKCLAKEPSERYQHADDLVVDLRAHLKEVDSGQPVPLAGTGQARSTGAAPRWTLPALAVTTTAALVLAALLGTRGNATVPEEPIRRFVIPLTPADSWPTAVGRTLVISPDAMSVAFVADSDDGRHLYYRSLAGTESSRLNATDSALHPFFSPDGEWIGFVQSGMLKKISLSDGRIVDLCEVDATTYATWGDDGTIVFSRRGLWRVSSQGGEPSLLAEPDRDAGEILYQRPAFLPGSDAVLFEILDATGPRIVTLSLDNGMIREVARPGIFPSFIPTGHVVFARGTSLHAMVFDPIELTTHSSAIQVLQGVAVTSGTTGGAANYSVAADGTLAYLSGEITAARRLVWVARDGTSTPLSEELHVFRHPKISPDRDRVAVSIEDPADPGRQDIWLFEAGLDSFRRLTFAGENFYAQWSPAGDRVDFTARRGEIASLFTIPSDFSAAEPELVHRNDGEVFNGIWSPDERWFVFRQGNPRTARDVMIQPGDRSEPPRGLLTSQFDEHSMTISPDGRWIAYVSDETGRDEVHATSFPEAGPRWQVSAGGGSEPVWAKDGTELFYRRGQSVTAVRVELSPEFRVGQRTVLFEGDYFAYRYHPQYDVSADGNRFLMIDMSLASGGDPTFDIVLNWGKELRQHAGETATGVR